jgi:acetyl esterase/lipase
LPDVLVPISPWLDPVSRSTDSYRTNARSDFITRSLCDSFMRLSPGHVEAQLYPLLPRFEQLFSAMGSASVTDKSRLHWPATLVVVGEKELLRDEGICAVNDIRVAFSRAVAEADIMIAGLHDSALTPLLDARRGDSHKALDRICRFMLYEK